MEYDAAGEPTGRLVTGADGGMATWADIKLNALNRGIVLTDADIGNIPSVTLNDITGLWSRGPGTGQMFLADMAHTADPKGKTADTDSATGLANTMARRPQPLRHLVARFAFVAGTAGERTSVQFDPLGFIEHTGCHRASGNDFPRELI